MGRLKTWSDYCAQRRRDEAFDAEAEGYDADAVMFEGIVMSKGEKAFCMRKRREMIKRDAKMESRLRGGAWAVILAVAVGLTLFWNIGAGLVVSALMAWGYLRTRRKLIREGRWNADTEGLWE
jgi:hypothetical protein